MTRLEPGPTEGALVVVADTTPLLYLARLELLGLLPALFHRVVVPGAVWRELVEVRPGALGVAALLAVDWIEVDASADGSALAQELSAELDGGEAAAIALALARRADLLLIDERDGRRAALAHGLRVRGTVGILLAARERHLLPKLRPALDALLATGFRLERSLYEDALRAAEESDR
jgi:predicted nucleic acid-binding protein